MLKNFIAAFAMYSNIPMPQIDFDDDSNRYSLCFFPLVGVAIGIFFLSWYALAQWLALSAGLFAVIALCIPLLVTGGLHMDGLIDTADAIHSYAEPQKKLAILKDPHIGAFGLIGSLIHFVLQWAFFQELYLHSNLILFVPIGYVLSRCLAALMIVTVKPARQDGLARIFSDSANKKTVQHSLLVYLILLSVGFAILHFVWFCISGLMITLAFFRYKKKMIHLFGGITGDLSGAFLQQVELLILAIAMAAGIAASIL